MFICGMHFNKYAPLTWLIFGGFLFISEQCVAQKFGAQLSLGFNASQVDGDQYAGYNKAGLHTGIAVNRRVKEKWLAQFEILYSGKGSRKRTSEEDMTIFGLRYRYIELPLLAIYEWNQKLALHAGPSAGFNIGADFDDGRGWLPSNPPINKYEIAGHIGAAYQLSDRIELNLRHSLSIIRAGNPNNGSQFYRITANGLYNRLFTFSLRYDLMSD
jgi:hypothetical protein